MFIFELLLGGQFPADFLRKDRITSYNVCYTKLLRARVDWDEPPAAPEDMAAIAGFCAWLGVPFIEERRPTPESLAERGLSYNFV